VREARQSLENDGYCVLPAVLDAHELERIRQQVDAAIRESATPDAHGLIVPNAAVVHPTVSWLFRVPTLITSLRTFLGDRPLFTNHCDLHLDRRSGWHKDSGESVVNGGYFDAPQFGAELTVVKVAMYLQDEPEQGLWVVPGSQHDPVVRPSGTAVPSRAGDAIVFDVRLTHRGMAPPAQTRLGRLRQGRKSRRLGARPRLAVFFTVGRNTDSARRFARNNMRRQLQQTPHVSSRLDPQIAATLVEAGYALAQDDPSWPESADVGAGSG
jgi:hypothetical protein